MLFEIKGGSIHLPILKLMSSDIEAVAVQLRQKIQQAPDFFRDAPVLIDLQDLHDAESALNLSQLGRIMRECALIPVGVRGGCERLRQAAGEAGLAVLAEGRHESSPPQPPRPEPAATAQAPVQAEPAIGKLIDHPVRSGQRIYAAGGDLVVLAQVSAGAEIMADGNIHVYGALRGRALAGVQGNLHSRIFCMDLQAELIAIGGHYKVSENLDDSVRGKPVQIYLRDHSLIIEDI